MQPHLQANMEQSFLANGKLLLIGEYIVLDEAQSLALPTKFGQNMHVSTFEAEIEEIVWNAVLVDESTWFSVVFDANTLTIKETTDQKLAFDLQKILQQATLQNPTFFLANQSYRITTKLTYPQQWGLGSSSTLVALLAQWMKIDPYVLNQKTFRTSGYDIACAYENKPIFFCNAPEITVTYPQLKWNFYDDLYFVYLNQKQDTQAAVGKHYRNRPKDRAMINHLSDLVEKLSTAKELDNFEAILDEYQTILANFMQLPKVKEERFPEYEGCVKSLGTWGGDFVLVTYRDGMHAYLEEKGYSTILPYNDLVF